MFSYSFMSSFLDRVILIKLTSDYHKDLELLILLCPFINTGTLIAPNMKIQSAEQEKAQRSQRDVGAPTVEPSKSSEVELMKLAASNGRFSFFFHTLFWHLLINPSCYIAVHGDAQYFP